MESLESIQFQSRLRYSGLGKGADGLVNYPCTLISAIDTPEPPSGPFLPIIYSDLLEISDTWHDLDGGTSNLSAESGTQGLGAGWNTQVLRGCAEPV